MKKYIIGGLVGFILATAASANAEGVTKLIDQVVQGVFPVTVEGNSVGDAIVVDNKTYLPVREFGEAVGFTVTFTENREVVLTKNSDVKTPESTPAPSTPIPTPSQPSIPKEELIETLQSKIRTSKLALSYAEKDIKESPTNKDDLQRQIEYYTKLIADYEAQLTALQAQQ